MGKPGSDDLRKALAKVSNASGADKAKAASDAGRLGIDVTREVKAHTGPTAARMFADDYEHDLRQA